jgi:hypothetical protein
LPDPLPPGDPALPDPVLGDPVPPVPKGPLVGLTVEPFEDAEVDAEELGADGLTRVDAEAGAADVAGWLGVGVALTQVAVPLARGTVFLLCAALRLAAEDAGLAVLVVAVMVGMAVSVSVAVPVGVTVSVMVGVAVPLLLVPPPWLVAGLVAGVVGGLVVGVTLGVTDLVDLACADGDGGEVVGQAVTGALP